MQDIIETALPYHKNEQDCTEDHQACTSVVIMISVGLKTIIQRAIQ